MTTKSTLLVSCHSEYLTDRNTIAVCPVFELRQHQHTAKKCGGLIAHIQVRRDDFSDMLTDNFYVLVTDYRRKMEVRRGMSCHAAWEEYIKDKARIEYTCESEPYWAKI